MRKAQQETVNRSCFTAYLLAQSRWIRRASAVPLMVKRLGCHPQRQTHSDLRLVSDSCRQAGLRLKLAKCQFLQEQVEYLGHVLTTDGLKPRSRNTDKVLHMRAPKNKDEVRSFLGTAAYFRRFIEGYSKIAKPLNDLLKTNVRFTWAQLQQLAFSSFKTSLTSPPILAYVDFHQVQILTTDASYVGLRAILWQSSDGTPKGDRVVAYASRGLHGAEINYAVTDLVALAVVWAVRHFRHHLSGRKFVIYTDHAALPFIFNQANPRSQVSRWAAELLEYSFDAKYRPGKKNPADSLSRLL
jgi:hypothetical protein